MLLSQENCYLLIVDVQEKLVPLVQNSESLIANCHWLMRLARELDIPVIVSEQYPRGLGKSVEAIRTYWVEEEVLEKVHFSCLKDTTCRDRLADIDRPQVVIAGIESHVGILQTALELIESGKEVFVVEDAISARHDVDHRLAVERMRQAGIQIISKEIVFFEWLEQAGTDTFKALSKTFIQ